MDKELSPDAARERPSLTLLEETLAKIARLPKANPDDYPTFDEAMR